MSVSPAKTDAAQAVEEIAKRLERQEADRLCHLGPKIRQAMLWQEIVSPSVVSMLANCLFAGPADNSLRWLDDLAAAYLDYVSNSPFYSGPNP